MAFMIPFSDLIMGMKKAIKDGMTIGIVKIEKFRKYNQSLRYGEDSTTFLLLCEPTMEQSLLVKIF